jgi:predicted nucleic acid-binding protein
MIVIDASLGVKWFLDEVGSQEATELLVEHRKHVSVPDLFGIEVGGALIREANTRKTEASQYSWALARLGALLDGGAISTFRTGNKELANAANLALDLGHPLKDCVYLALAMELDCALHTCDRKFARKARDVWQAIEVL